MLYFTLEFAIAFLLFLIVYWSVMPAFGLGPKAQECLLLASNYTVIYCINPYFACVVCIYTFVVYALAVMIYDCSSRVVICLCLSILVLALCGFKYFDDIKGFFDSLFIMIGLSAINSDLQFPLGISFYTFSSITYLCSVYRKSLRHDSLDSTGSFVHVAIFLSFFPTFISGPIMRSDYFFSLLREKKVFGDVDIIIVLLIFGIVKKVFIANYLEIYSSPVLQNPNDYDSLSLLLAMYAYAVKLYCDFSGYVDLVSAFAMCLGFTLPINFNMPYTARNIRDFWSKWHISLSLFIRDYIYIPLGGNQRGFFLTQVFVLMSFALSGIWHGSTYNFLIWGILHGMALVFLNILKKLEFEITIPFISRIITFHFVVFTWIFFHYETFSESVNYIDSFLSNWDKDIDDSKFLWLSCFAIVFLLYPFCKDLQGKFAHVLMHMNTFVKICVISVLMIIIIGFSPSGIPNFIYSGF